MIFGRIVKGIGGLYFVNTEKGLFSCKARGVFRNKNISPMIGDFVKIKIIDEELLLGNIQEIIERKNELIRPKVSNVDQVVIVFAVKSPAINIELLDKLLVSFTDKELDIIICINKLDLCTKEDIDKITDIYFNIGYKLLFVSAKEKTGIDSLFELLQNNVSVFAGPSGVGKSSLINLLSSNVQMEIGELSSKINRGKHTTRHSELIQIAPAAFIVDSPGFTSLSIDFIKKDELSHLFKEFRPFIKDCKFLDCKHLNEPDCAIKARVGKEISSSRYTSYVSMRGIK